MKIYRVGGSVRDELLGRPSHDADWVVVGATPQQMLDAGYQAVGKDFPVFLHPDTHEEYALARTERKTAPGYKGFAVLFAPDVSLEDDLSRRDLTINAMARSADGELIDPHGGRHDLEQRVFRHVSDAFAEDPVRILRLARFAARFNDFTVHPDTLTLMRSMVANGEVAALVAERVWQELARGLMEAAPTRLFEVLADCGALAVLLPGLSADARMQRVFTRAGQRDAPLTARFALLAWLATQALPDDMPSPEALTSEQASDGASDQATDSVEDLAAKLANRLRAPIDCRELAKALVREAGPLAIAKASPADQLRLLERIDALRRPARFEELLLARACLDDGAAFEAAAARLRRALDAARQVDAGAIARPLASQGSEKIRAAVFDARAAAIAGLSDQMDQPPDHDRQQ